MIELYYGAPFHSLVVWFLLLHTCVGARIIHCVSVISFWCFVLLYSVICLLRLELYDGATFVVFVFGVVLMHLRVSAIMLGHISPILFLRGMFF